MGSKRISQAAAFGLLLGLAIVACTSGPRIRYPHEYTLTPGLEHQAKLSSVLLVPVNYTNQDPVKGLQVADARIATTITRHLMAKGISVERPEPIRFRSVVDAAYQTTRSERIAGASDTVSTTVEFGDVVPEILETLEPTSDLVVVANVVMRTGRWNGGSTLVWDGVRRRDRTAGTGATTGTSPGASLEVAVYTRDGTRVFSGFGGLDLVFKFNLQKRVIEVREDLLENERNLAEGVCIAFYPYFGLEESCVR